MCDDYTRENRIKEMSLEIQLSAIYLSAVSITAALIIFIIGSSAYPDISKVIIIPVLCLFLYQLLLQFRKKKKDIQNIFHCDQIADNPLTPDKEDISTKSDGGNGEGKKGQDHLQLSNLIIVICVLMFLVSCWVVISLLSFNNEVSKILITGNLSPLDENQGKGLLGLFSPYIGIFFALALFCLTVAYNTWSRNESSKKLSEINENIKEIKKKIL